MAIFGAEDIGIDLGTATVRIAVRGKGVVLREPAVVAIDRETGGVLAVGNEARQMQGRTPGNKVAIRPMRDGSIADYDMVEQMLRHFLRKVMGNRMLFRPRALVCVPRDVTDIEKQSIIDTLLDAGMRRAQLVEEPLAAAIGAGVNIDKAYGSMIVNIGGGITDLAVVAMGRTVVSMTSKVAGDRFDEAIARYLRRKHNLMVGERSAEQLKINIGSACSRLEPLFRQISGRNLITGLPKTIEVSSEETVEALDEPIQELIEHVHALLERTPPELAADVFERGIIMTGGGAQLFGLDAVLTEQIRIRFMLAEEPGDTVVIGTSRILDDMENLGKVVLDADSLGRRKR